MAKFLSGIFILGLLVSVAHADIEETAASVFKIDENTNYDSNLKLRDQRKLGVGAEVGGTLGLYGADIELNIEDADGVKAGFGGGPGYNSFALQWKHTFEGDNLAPYTSLGYSRWYNSAGDTKAAKDSSILSRVLSDEDKRTGRFATNFLTASGGIQYTHLTGEFAGTSFFAELTLLGEVERSVLVPTGAVGAMYYF